MQTVNTLVKLFQHTHHRLSALVISGHVYPDMKVYNATACVSQMLWDAGYAISMRYQYASHTHVTTYLSNFQRQLIHLSHTV